MSDWNKKTIADICKLVAGSAFNIDYQGRSSGDIQFIKVSDLNLSGNERRITRANHWVTNQDVEDIRAKVHPIGATIFAKIGVALTYNRRRQLTRPTIIDNNMMAAIPDTSIVDSEYLYYLLCTIDFNLIASGSALPYINKSDIEKIEIELPPLSEQRSIVNILSTLDDKIEVNRRMNETQEGIARALFRSWFIDFDPVRAKAMGCQPFGMNEETAGLFPDRFEVSDLGEIPNGWRTITLNEVIDCHRGLSYKGSHLGEPGIPLHNLNSVFEGGGYKHSGIKYYSGDYQKRHTIHPGELVVTNTEQGFDYLLIGFPAIIPYKFGEVGLFSHHLFKIVPKPEMGLAVHFLYFLLMAPTLREQVISCTNGTTVNMLSPDGLTFPKFVFPPSRLISLFEGVVSNLYNKMEVNLENMELLQQMRNRLLPKLISGEIRTNPSEVIN